MGRAFKQHVQAEVARRLNETVLPHYNEMQERLKQYDQVRKGVMDSKRCFFTLPMRGF